MIIKVINNDIDSALKDCKRAFGEIKRRKRRYLFYLRPGLKLKEKKKIAEMKRKFY